MPNKRVVLSILTAVCVLGCVGQASCSIIRVKWDSPNDGPGHDWDHAYHTVTAGLAAAVSGDEVWVAAGTYVERITLKGGVALYGGFAGTETRRYQRNWRTNVTILDGNQGGTVVTSPSGATATTRIDGFTIQNGNSSSYGGGISCPTSSPTVANNTITGNTAACGAAGVSCCSSSPMLTNNAITGNWTPSAGGGVLCYSSSSPTITNNAISGNSASDGGGISCSASSPTITNNTITGNSAFSDGGGICCNGSSSPAILNNIVAFNSSGIYKSGGAPTLRSNDIYGNAFYDYSGLSAGSGDICADPMFVSREYGNTHIRPVSPCVNAGWNSAPGLATTDMDGQARIQQGIVDIGADESDGSDPPGGAYAVIRVSPDGSDSNDGSTWALAKRTVQAGIDAASLQRGDVWVKAGTYSGGITLRLHVHAYGGFAGTEAARSERNWAANRSIVDGGGAGPAVTVPPGLGYGLAGVDGFTIRNGKASSGGGVYCSHSSPRITNSVVTQNTATDAGGGISCYCSAPTITDATIAGNSARYVGGGISCYRSSPAITSSMIADNSAKTKGGGLWCFQSSPIVASNTITANSGGGISCDYHSAPVITTNKVTGNVGSGISSDASSPVITNNIITGNGTSMGGGIYCSASSPTITSNTITGNSASSYGGGVYLKSSSSAISNNIVAFNSSGLHSSASTLMLRNNDVFGNTAYDYSGLSAGVGDISADPMLVSEDYGNAHIRPDSPCVDAGWNDAPGLPLADIDGQPRVHEGTVDIGADESDGSDPPAGPYIVVRVSPDGSDSNDGSSWLSPKRKVQAGIDAASALGGEVWVRAGTYNELITLRPYAYLYGGFAGIETARSERDWAANRSIIDGGAAGSVVTAKAGYRYSAVDGFTIRNGSAMANGGGIYCQSSSPTITNDTVIGNFAKYDGGGIFCGSDSSPVIANNAIAANRCASRGGGIFCFTSSPIVTNNTITQNVAADGGGGICCSISSPAVSNDIVAFNSSGIYQLNSAPTLRNNDVYGNTAYDYSGLSPGEGDISADPLFVDTDNGDYHVTPFSPCIDAGWNDAPGLPLLDFDGQSRIWNGIVDIGADELWPLTVLIDIKPGAYPNPINLRSKGLIPVAILSEPGFDAASVDPGTVKFAGAPIATRGPSNRPMAGVQDVDGDADLDLLLHFETRLLQLNASSTSASLTGRTYDGWPIEGSDSILVVADPRSR